MNLLVVAGEQRLTPLHDAVNVGAVQVIKTLLKYGGWCLLLN